MQFLVWPVHRTFARQQDTHKMAMQKKIAVRSGLTLLCICINISSFHMLSCWTLWTHFGYPHFGPISAPAWPSPHIEEQLLLVCYVVQIINSCRLQFEIEIVYN